MKFQKACQSFVSMCGRKPSRSSAVVVRLGQCLLRGPCRMSELRACAMDVVRRLSRCRRFLGLPVEELLADWRRPQSRSENNLQEIVQLLRRWKQLASVLEGLSTATVLELQANCSDIGFDLLAEGDSPLTDEASLENQGHPRLEWGRTSGRTRSRVWTRGKIPRYRAAITVAKGAAALVKAFSDGMGARRPT